MSMIYNNYTPFQYGISGTAKIATHFYPLEKASKIAYRVIDLANLFIEYPRASLVLLSSQIKELILFIESTRFSCVSFPLFFPDKDGRTYFQQKPWAQCAEKISLTTHLALKTLFGADRTGLIHLGTIGTYALGNMPVFRWMLEGSIWMYNFFGTFDGAYALSTANDLLAKIPTKIDSDPKNREWTEIKNDLLFDHTKAQLKIAARVSKLVLITLAVTVAVLGVTGALCQISILSLGIISDAFGLIAFYHQEYYKSSVPVCVPE